MPIHKLNRTRNRLLHANGNPSRGYLGLLEVSHQLHCLNQYTWKPYYAAHADLFANLSDTIDLDLADTIDLDLADARDVGDRMHVDHCLETLRLTLMCNADVTPTVRWRERCNSVRLDSAPESHLSGRKNNGSKRKVTSKPSLKHLILLHT
ncbi:hypothetical protein PMIN06_004335 [Paraphaeosphaeria minitans]